MQKNQFKELSFNQLNQLLHTYLITIQVVELVFIYERMFQLIDMETLIDLSIAQSDELLGLSCHLPIH